MKQNQVPSNFDFMKYINLSLQDDFSHVRAAAPHRCSTLPSEPPLPCHGSAAQHV